MKKYLLCFMISFIVITTVGCGGGGRKGNNVSPPSPSLIINTVGSVSFIMRYAPSGSFTSDDKIVSGDSNLSGSVTVADAFWIAETEVTYELWKVVYDWADGNEEYHITNKGREGNDGTEGADPTEARHEPVTGVGWYDVVVWCNALTEYYNEQNGTNLDCVYKLDGSPVRDTRNDMDIDDVVPDVSAKGFRLPTSNEWQLAARYQDGTNWTPGNHVSGDTTGPCWTGDETGLSAVFGNYAWYSDNENHTHIVGTAGSSYPSEPKSGNANALGLYDMSGNVWEWCFDWHPNSSWNYCRIQRGGSWRADTEELQLGFVDKDFPDSTYDDLGFRLVRTRLEHL